MMDSKQNNVWRVRRVELSGGKHRILFNMMKERTEKQSKQPFMAGQKEKYKRLTSRMK
jgi:hypothetical protein